MFQVEPLFCSWITHHIPNWQNCIVVSPDEGGAKRSVMLANDLGLDFAMIHNRHKKTLKQITPTISRKTSVIEPERDDLTGEIVSEGRDIKGISELPLKQLIFPYTTSCIKDSLEIPLLSLSEGDNDNLPEELRLTHKQVDRYLKISGDVAGMDCILVDDMIDTGATIRLALEVLHSHNAG